MKGEVNNGLCLLKKLICCAIEQTSTFSMQKEKARLRTAAGSNLGKPQCASNEAAYYNSSHSHSRSAKYPRETA